MLFKKMSELWVFWSHGGDRLEKNLHQTLSQYFMGEVNNDRTWQKITEMFAMHYWIWVPNKVLWLTDDLLRQTESG